MDSIEKIAIWSAELNDVAGSHDRTFECAIECGKRISNFVLARRQPDKPGKGIIFVSPLQGPEAGRSGPKRPVSCREAMPWVFAWKGPTNPV